MSPGERTASGHSEIYIFSLLYEAAQYAIEAARKHAARRMHFCLHSLVSSAFCIEAYLNHVGEEELTLWNAPERKSTRTKLDLVCSRTSIVPDFDARPWSSFEWLMEFRGKIAHARTEIRPFSNKPLIGDPAMPEREISQVEEACTIENAMGAVQDVRAMIEIIGKALGSPVTPLLAVSNTQWTAPLDD